MADERRPSANRSQLWLIATPGEAGHDRVADVALKLPLPVPQSFAVPRTLVDQVRPGAWVTVPHARRGRPVEGLCLRVTERPWDHTLRPVLAAAPGVSWLTPNLVELGLWVGEYYACSPWRTFCALLPAPARQPRLRTVRYLRATGAPPTRPLTPAQAALVAALASGELPRTTLLRQTNASAETLRGLLARGLIACDVRKEPVPRWTPPDTAPPAPAPEDAFELTAGQRAAYERIVAALDQPNGFAVLVLLGVPGSGKTEVYVRALRATNQRGRQAILLIPEIALATQIVERMRRRFGRVAILHSHLPDQQRADTLAAIAAGEVELVIGTRPAVFAPCPHLGLIVVDEEQEGSYKNLAAPYYHARDVAIKRGQLENVPVVLGSATPALETWYNAAHRGHYELIRLPERVPGAKLPEVHLVTAEPHQERHAAILSPPLREHIGSALDAAQQVILLHNRRGFAIVLRCSRCGLVLACERCGGKLAYHRLERVLKCHRCGVRHAPPQRCLDDSCGGPLAAAGAGVQRLEEELRRTFPAARLLRLDADTMRRREDYEAALRGFERGEADILLGTQMVAKGLDFPHVQLVGVVAADAALALPDFRAAERVFQLVVQVVGRAGRRAGRSVAIIQASARPPAVIHHALRLDYERFAADELALREKFFYPPLARMVRLICADARPHQARTEAERLAAALRVRAGRVHAALRIDDAQPCVIRRLRELLRYQVTIRGPRGGSVRALLAALTQEPALRPRVTRFTIDVDPLDLL